VTLPAFQSKKERQGEDCTPFDLIRESDVLIAILKGSTSYQMSKTSKPILRHPKFKEMIRDVDDNLLLTKFQGKRKEEVKEETQRQEFEVTYKGGLRS